MALAQAQVSSWLVHSLVPTAASLARLLARSLRSSASELECVLDWMVPARRRPTCTGRGCGSSQRRGAASETHAWLRNRVGAQSRARHINKRGQELFESRQVTACTVSAGELSDSLHIPAAKASSSFLLPFPVQSHGYERVAMTPNKTSSERRLRKHGGPLALATSGGRKGGLAERVLRVVQVLSLERRVQGACQ